MNLSIFKSCVEHKEEDEMEKVPVKDSVKKVLSTIFGLLIPVQVFQPRDVPYETFRNQEDDVEAVHEDIHLKYFSI